MKYYPRSAVIDVEVWNKPGDLTGDLPLIGGEGQIVKNYSRPGVAPLSTCNVCKNTLSRHGWLPSPIDHETAHLAVDPNTGKVIQPKPIAAAASAEGTEAEAEGAGAAVAVAEPAPPEAVAEPQPGLVIHPGDFVDKNHHQRWRPEEFKQQFDRAE